MDLSNDDLENCVEKFRNVFLQHGNNRRNENDLLLLIDNLSEELNISKENEDVLQNKIKRILESKNCDITKKYVFLEEKCRKLEHENKELLVQLNDLTVQMNTKLELQKDEFLHKIEEHVENSKLRIANLENRIESEKICYASKEKELHDELQAGQAAYALQYDELESNMKRQLVEANSKFRQSQNTIRSLQLEITNLKNQLFQQQRSGAQRSNNVLHFQPTPIQSIKNNIDRYISTNIDFYEVESESGNGNAYNKQFNDNHERTSNNGPSSRPPSTASEYSTVTKVLHNHDLGSHDNNLDDNISDFQRKNPEFSRNLKESSLDYSVKVIQNNAQNQHESHFNDRHRPQQIPTPRQQKELESSAKYPPLPLSNAGGGNQELRSVEVARKQNCPPVLYRGSANRSRQNNGVPPLLPCSNSKDKKKPLRKRKLYNPDDYESLENIIV